MDTAIPSFNVALARALGIRFTLLPDGSATLPKSDGKLYLGALNPASKVSERYLKHCGNSHLWIAGIDTFSDSPFYYLDHLADVAPHLPHLRVWADRFKPKHWSK